MPDIKGNLQSGMESGKMGSLPGGDQLSQTHAVMTLERFPI